MDADTSFDYVSYGSLDTYDLSFRIVRFPLSDGSFECLVNLTVIKHDQTRHEYKVNFSMAAYIGRVFLRLTTQKDPIDVMSLLKKELIPVRKERQYPRLQTAHFRKPRYFIYRPA